MSENDLQPSKPGSAPELCLRLAASAIAELRERLALHESATADVEAVENLLLVRGWEDRPTPVLTARRCAHPLRDLAWIQALRATRRTLAPGTELTLLVSPSAIQLLAWQGRGLYPGSIRAEVWPPVAEIVIPQMARPPLNSELFPRTGRILDSEEALRYWQSLQVAVVGAGRMGSAVVNSLVAQGIHRFVLIDGDTLEGANLDGMDLVGSRHVGWPKVEALRHAVQERFQSIEVHVVAMPLDVGSLETLAALATASVLICAVDNAAPRLTAAAMARQLGMPLLDLGSRSEARGAVADLRLVVPGSRCFLCLGGITPQTADERRAVGTSPRLINAAAANLGAAMLMDLVGRSREAQSRWMRLEAQPQGSLRTIEMNPASTFARPCPWCGRTRGAAEP